MSDDDNEPLFVEESHDEKMRRLAEAHVSRVMGAESDAYFGLLGAIIFAFGGISGYGLIATGIGFLLFLVLVFGVWRRVAFKTFLIGMPALAMFVISAATKVQQLIGLG